MPVKALPPQGSASTNFATWADAFVRPFEVVLVCLKSTQTSSRLVGPVAGVTNQQKGFGMNAAMRSKHCFSMSRAEVFQATGPECPGIMFKDTNQAPRPLLPKIIQHHNHTNLVQTSIVHQSGWLQYTRVRAHSFQRNYRHQISSLALF